VDWSAPKISLLAEESIACFHCLSYVSRMNLSILIIAQSMRVVTVAGRLFPFGQTSGKKNFKMLDNVLKTTYLVVYLTTEGST
jgi:hypothetical protein